MSSIFTRPRARPPLAAVSSQQVFREVNTEDELRAAVFSDTIGAYTFGITGRRIVIASPISVKSPIVVTASGTTIESHGKIPVFPAADALSCIFDISSAVNVTIRNLMFSNTGNFVEPDVCVKLGSLNDMLDCTVVTGTTAIIADTDSFVRGNKIFFGTFGVSIIGSASVVTGNMITSGIATADPFSSRNVITSNVLFNSNIDTSTSGGQNVIVGNAQVGTITNAATDAVTSNT